MMFGMQDEFRYFQCNACGCLQIENMPDNLSNYYPDSYYSFREEHCQQIGGLKYFLKRQQSKHHLGSRNLVGAVVSNFFKPRQFIEWTSKAGTSLTSEILDVGCGSGGLLLELREHGFTQLTGIDPYIQADLHYSNGVHIYKRNLSDVEQTFDFVMLHHVFEHVVDPLGALKDVYRVLRPQRYALVRVPLVSSYAWQTYGVDWVQLDAPRHLYLHTPSSLKLLAERANFQVSAIVYDSTEFQFLGSEQYKRGIPLQDKRSYYQNPEHSIFSKSEVKQFRAKATELNYEGVGDQAAFYLYKP